MDLTIDYNEQLLNYYPEVFKNIREVQELSRVEGNEIQKIHNELDQILKNNYFDSIEIEPIKSDIEVTVDTGGAIVTICGLNLWDEQTEIGGISSSNGQNADNVTNVLRTKNYVKVMPGKLYYIKCPSGLVATGGLIQIYRYDENKNFLGYGSTGVENGQFNSSNWHYIRFVIRKEYGLTYNNDICLSFDNEATNGMYEPYKGSTYTADGEGNVEGVKSVYPNMTLMTDTAGVIIDCEYNKLDESPKRVSGEFISITDVSATYSDCVKEVSTTNEFKISRWEHFLGIIPLPQGNDDLGTWLSDRQETIVARLFNVSKLNSESISDIVKVFTGGTATSYFKDGMIYVGISPPKGNKQYKFENVEQELRHKIPAHLGLSVAPSYFTWDEVFSKNATWGDVKNNHTDWKDVLYHP